MNKDEATNTFGVPQSVVAAIPGVLSMQKNLHHNRRLALRPHQRSTFTRVLMIIISILLLLPGAFFMYVAYLAFTETGMTATIIPATLGIIFIGGGIAGIISNIRN